MEHVDIYYREHRDLHQRTVCPTKSRQPMRRTTDMKIYLLLLLLSVLRLRDVSCSSPCSEVEHREMQEEFTECRSGYTTIYHDSGSGGGLCTLLDQIINICSQKWKQCHTSQEIKRMKKMHTSAFIQHWGKELENESCPTVLLFRESEAEEAADDGGCTQTESTAAMSSFQNCAHTISSHLYGQVSGLTVHRDLVSLLCRALSNISIECPVHLHTCLAPADVSELTSMLQQQMKGYFSNLVNNRVSLGDLDACEKSAITPTEASIPMNTNHVVQEDIDNHQSDTDSATTSTTTKHPTTAYVDKVKVVNRIDVISKEVDQDDWDDDHDNLDEEITNVRTDATDEKPGTNYLDSDADMEDPYKQVLRDLNLEDLSYDSISSMTDDSYSDIYASWSSEDSLDDISRILKVTNDTETQEITQADPRTVQTHSEPNSSTRTFSAVRPILFLCLFKLYS